MRPLITPKNYVIQYMYHHHTNIALDHNQIHNQFVHMLVIEQLQDFVMEKLFHWHWKIDYC